MVGGRLVENTRDLVRSKERMLQKILVRAGRERGKQKRSAAARTVTEVVKLPSGAAVDRSNCIVES